MIIKFVEIQNFRKLKACRIDFAEKETVFVGANNSGKTSALDALVLFLEKRGGFYAKDFTLSNWKDINEIGDKWLSLKEEEIPDLGMEKWQDFLPQLDLWLDVPNKEIHYVRQLIPTLDWGGGKLGIRFRYEPNDIAGLYKDFVEKHRTSEKLRSGKPKSDVKLWPASMWDYLDNKNNLRNHFSVKTYILDPDKVNDSGEDPVAPQVLPGNATCLDFDPLKGLIKIDTINAQRGFSDANAENGYGVKSTSSLTSQFKDYYTRHLDPFENPTEEDIIALKAIQGAEKSFDERLNKSFEPSLGELTLLNYPGFGGNPGITLATRLTAIEGLSHGSAVQFEVMKGEKDDKHPFLLPEDTNGLGYQNLISMIFKLIRFRDERMRVGKLEHLSSEPNIDEFQPLHLVLVEEPEAHLHAQVQQVFIKKAYGVLHASKVFDQHPHLKTQMVVSTHSNHIAHEIDFTSLRYFKRKDSDTKNTPTSTVVNLTETFGNKNETTKFATRYLRSTHCDIFFADAVILVEGSAERMLVPHFIRTKYKGLDSSYISLLEIGGSHAHRLQPLIETLGMPTLVITDIDPVDPKNNNSGRKPEKGQGYETGNSALKKWHPKKKLLDDLLGLPAKNKEMEEHPIRFAYQFGIKLKEGKIQGEVIPHTFESALALDNFSLFKDLKGTGLFPKINKALNKGAVAEIEKELYDVIKDTKLKAEFALELLWLEDPRELEAPQYIAEGLAWLSEKLGVTDTKSVAEAKDK